MKPTNRTVQLRRALVATVDAAPFSRRLPRRRVIVAAVTALITAGLAGGAVGATAQGDPDSEEIQFNTSLVANMFERGRVEVVGDVQMIFDVGGTTVDLGSAPANATDVAFVLECIDGGSFDLLLDDQKVMTMPCGIDHGGVGLGEPISQGHVARIVGTGRFILWIAWLHVNPEIGMSPEQTAALSDGIVTREEYLAGFQRFVDCMAIAGYPVQLMDTSGDVMEYSLSTAAVATGTDEACYAPEFKHLDAEWQTRNEPKP